MQLRRARWIVGTVLAALASGVAQSAPAWLQWGQNPQHSGNLAVQGQSPQARLANLVFDPFVSQETIESRGALLMHYQVPLVNGSTVYMEFKTGTYVSCQPAGSGQPFPCGPDAWNTEIWNESALQWQNGQLVQLWNFATDWVPVPNSGTQPSKHALGGWEPLFQPALAGQYIYVPGAGGTVYKLNQSDGSVASQINPFESIDPGKFVVGGLSADAAGNIYYNVIQVNPAWPWDVDALNSWLVKVGADDSSAVVTYASLLPNAPTQCLGTFAGVPLPWPPSANAVPPNVNCGSQRAALNLAPAISADGLTVYTVSRGHFWPRNASLLAINTADLSLQWSTSLQGLLADGCNVLLPPNGQPGGCSLFAATGVDPTQNTLGGGIVNDQESASPVVAPDGSILIGTNTAYNYGRGHLFKFSPQGLFLASYDFGWDSTPSIYAHDGTYSVILKDNHYSLGSYCSDPIWCPAALKGPYYVTQLDSNLNIEWQFQNKTTNGGHPNGFEWCVNDAAVDLNGTVYADDEDGYLYVIPQGGAPVQKTFLNRAINAGYTPVSLGGDGLIYAQNAGHMMAVGQLLASSTQVTSSLNPATYGNPITFTASVSSAGTPTGTVNFKPGAIVLGTGTLNNATASYTTTPSQLPAGNFSITAVYKGDSIRAGSTSPVVAQVVSKAATTTALIDQPNPSSVGQIVALTATVSAAPATPTGNVVFRIGNTIVGTAPLSSGVATLNYTFNTAGSFQVKATYQVSGNYLSSSATAVQAVQ
jgi:Big-like domain-containing protein